MKSCLRIDRHEVSPQMEEGRSVATWRWLRRFAWISSISLLLFAIGYVSRGPILTELGRAWVVNQPTTKADAIVILGGGPETRPFAAARLYQAGIAPLILYTDVKLGPAETMGITPPEREQTRRILSSNAVPEKAMALIGTNVASTYDEAVAVREWVAKNGAKSIVIPTDPFHTRRVRWVFDKELRDSKVEVHVVAVDAIRYREQDWWQHEEGMIAFQNEVAKYFYYRIKY